VVGVGVGATVSAVEASSTEGAGLSRRTGETVRVAVRAAVTGRSRVRDMGTRILACG
jgi:hypothetical protein